MIFFYIYIRKYIYKNGINKDRSKIPNNFPIFNHIYISFITVCIHYSSKLWEFIKLSWIFLKLHVREMKNKTNHKQSICSYERSYNCELYIYFFIDLKRFISISMSLCFIVTFRKQFLKRFKRFCGDYEKNKNIWNSKTTKMFYLYCNDRSNPGSYCYKIIPRVIYSHTISKSETY